MVNALNELNAMAVELANKLAEIQCKDDTAEIETLVQEYREKLVAEFANKKVEAEKEVEFEIKVVNRVLEKVRIAAETEAAVENESEIVSAEPII